MHQFLSVIKNFSWGQVTLFVLGLALSNAVQAQQQLLFTQYMFNNLAINPAYAGSDEALNVTVLGRRQWIGFDGGPNNQIFSIHKPVKNKKMALGAVLSREKMAVTEALNFYAVYAYKIQMEKGTLSFGLQAGATNYRQNLTELQLPSGVSDPSFNENISEIHPNVGTGIFFNTKKYYFGFSVPLLLQNTLENDEAVLLAKQSRHYFLSGGYVFELNPELKFKPHFLLRAVEGASPNVDINANFLIKEKLWLGLAYRSSGSVSALVEFLVNERFRLGFAYDFILSGFNQNNSGSIEGLLNYRYMKAEDGRVMSPRYF